MKTIAILFLNCVFLISCQAQKHKLELNLNAGEIYTQNLTSNMTVSQTINGQQMNIDATIICKTNYKVMNVEDTIYTIDIQYESLSMKMAMPNGEVEFSSEKSDENDIVSTLLGMMKTKTFTARMSKSGKVFEVKNIESLFSGIFEKYPHVTEAQKQQIMKQIKQAYGEKAFIGNLEMVTAIFSNSPVAKGDKWVIKTQLESGMSSEMETTYELVDINDSHGIIVGNATIKTADKDAYLESNGMPLKYNLQGTMIDNYTIDIKTGWIIEAKVTQTIKGTAEIKDNPKMPGGMIIPMEISNKMIMTN
jgi:hypothetical protein